ncbi:hypothetical protein DFH29DRAFT_927837 [Suillus ampliporus]|nr:hypothetical protein DFH29DRAFT_927837 [Suillus ampliporus]
MHQRSRKVLILLVVVFLAVNIACVVLAGILMRHSSGEEFILSGTYQCHITYEMAYVCTSFLGYSAPYGRSSHCVSQYGLL